MKHHEDPDCLSFSSCNWLQNILSHMVTAVDGITADANILIHHARFYAQQHTMIYQEPVPVENLVLSICNLKQGYTQSGGNQFLIDQNKKNLFYLLDLRKLR